MARDDRVRQTPGIARSGPRPRDADGCIAIVRPSGRYPCVSIVIGGKRRVVGVHWLKLTTFIGPRPTPRHRAVFLDGDHANLSLDNLRWMTPIEFSDLMIRLGRMPHRATRTRRGVQEYMCRRCGKWKPTVQFYRYTVKTTHRPQTHQACRSCYTVIGRLRDRGTELPAPPLLDLVLVVLAPRCKAKRDRAWVGQRLLTLRRQRGLTRPALARAAGVGITTLRTLELGRHLPTVRTLKKLLAVLNG